MQVKTMRYHTHLLEWPESETTTPYAGADVEQPELAFIAGENAVWYSHIGRQFGSLSHD